MGLVQDIDRCLYCDGAKMVNYYYHTDEFYSQYDNSN